MSNQYSLLISAFFRIFAKTLPMYQTLLLLPENGILTIVINRADKLNALNKEVFTELNMVLDEIEKSPAIKSVIITGAGSKAFVAGADITEFKGTFEDRIKGTEPI